MTEHIEIYNNPLASRYASKGMLKLLSDKHKYIIWRKLWLALAKGEKKAGLNISQSQIEELELNINNLDIDRIKLYEEELQHEVMAHIKGFADVCKLAAPIIHLGETSAFVLDNGDIVIAKEALILLQQRFMAVIKVLSDFANTYKAMPTLSFTHLQPAQPTTIGKRACLWLNSLVEDYKSLTQVISSLKLRGVKGTTGTAASFYKLLKGDYTKLKTIEQEIAINMGFDSCYAVTSQTYDRKVDVSIANVLTQIAISLHKISNDFRILQNMGELEEPFKEKQVGSSAMPYKKNPMLAERISALAKFIMSLSSSTYLVAATQWLERTLDDSANKRLVLPQMFLATDGILLLLEKIIKGLKVNTKVVEQNINKMLPFMVTENILMEYVKKGGNRQQGHEKIREYAIIVNKQIKEEGLANNLMNLIAEDKDFNLSKDELNKFFNANELIGFSSQQVEDFLQQEVTPLITVKS